MKTIERYVFTSFLTSFLLAFLVLTFVLTIGLMFQIIGFILDGLSASLIGRFVLVSFPETLQWTVPLAILVASVLVFSRLSADSEVSAMRACGINLYSVMKWPAAFGLACSLLGGWVNNEVVPRGHEIRRSLMSKVSVGNCIEALKPGVWYDDFPGVKLLVERKEGRRVEKLRVVDDTSGFSRQITAESAIVTEEGRDVHIDLHGMWLQPIDRDNPNALHFSRFQHVIEDALRESSYAKKFSDLRFFELVSDIGRRGREIDAAARAARELRRAGRTGGVREIRGKVPFDAWYAALEPETWIDCFGRARIRFARKSDMWLEDVEIEELADGKVVRQLRAPRAHVTPRRKDIIFDLAGAAEGTDASDQRFEISGVLSSSLREMRRSLSKAKVELSSRLVLAAASLCFVLVGVPLGIRAQRRESTIGMAISLAIALGYYLCVMLMESLQKSYSIHPEFLIWLPVVASLALAGWFTRKNL